VTKINYYKEIEEKRKKIEQARIDAERMEEVKRSEEIEEKKQMKLKYKNSVKQLIALCDNKFPGTRYDRFYCEEMVKKYPKQQELDELVE
jgi:hypothetical protein